MRLPGRTERRLALAILLVALVPLFASIYVARSLVNYTTGLFYNAHVGDELEASLGVYNDLAKAMKEGLRAKADAIAAQEPLRAAAILRHKPSLEQELAGAFKRNPDLVSLTVVSESPDEARENERVPERIASQDRGRPIDEATERRLEIARPLSDREGAPWLVAVFAAPRGRLDYVERSAAFLQEYRAVERQRADVERTYLFAFAALVGITIPVAVLIGSLLARQVTRRINRLASATQAVGAGDLSVRVAEEGSDEVTDLARAFNTMVGEVEESRARIEFLKRMGTWQEMARRLAHEIKNPLTPIQLAVQECQRRYGGGDRDYQRLLDTTREIVEEEVGTLRRLVGEFSNFARLPRAELRTGDLAEFLREQKTRLSVVEDGEFEEDVEGLLAGVILSWQVPDDPMPAAFDPQMLHRVLVNVVGNAAQAIRGARGTGGHVVVRATTEGSFHIVDVEDDGPGVSPEVRMQIFDPYFTTKADGTGLGLAIVKKIVVEHGGTIEAGESSAGGARMRIRVPRLGTLASEAALQAGAQPVSQRPPAPSAARAMS
jgi:two-component system, NtrC family, nitrogen regulation sensor histidine kinase NtrY